MTTTPTETNNVASFPSDHRMGVLYEMLYETLEKFSNQHTIPYAAVIGVLEMVKTDLLVIQYDQE